MSVFQMPSIQSPRNDAEAAILSAINQGFMARKMQKEQAKIDKEKAKEAERVRREEREHELRLAAIQNSGRTYRSGTNSNASSFVNTMIKNFPGKSPEYWEDLYYRTMEGGTGGIPAIRESATPKAAEPVKEWPMMTFQDFMRKKVVLPDFQEEITPDRKVRYRESKTGKILSPEEYEQYKDMVFVPAQGKWMTPDDADRWGQNVANRYNANVGYKAIDVGGDEELTDEYSPRSNESLAAYQARTKAGLQQKYSDAKRATSLIEQETKLQAALIAADAALTVAKQRGEDAKAVAKMRGEIQKDLAAISETKKEMLSQKKMEEASAKEWQSAMEKYEKGLASTTSKAGVFKAKYDNYIFERNSKIPTITKDLESYLLQQGGEAKQQAQYIANYLAAEINLNKNNPAPLATKLYNTHKENQEMWSPSTMVSVEFRPHAVNLMERALSKWTDERVKAAEITRPNISDSVNALRLLLTSTKANNGVVQISLHNLRLAAEMLSDEAYTAEEYGQIHDPKGLDAYRNAQAPPEPPAKPEPKAKPEVTPVTPPATGADKPVVTPQSTPTVPPPQGATATATEQVEPFDLSDSGKFAENAFKGVTIRPNEGMKFQVLVDGVPQDWTYQGGVFVTPRGNVTPQWYHYMGFANAEDLKEALDSVIETSDPDERISYMTYFAKDAITRGADVVLPEQADYLKKLSEELKKYIARK